MYPPNGNDNMYMESYYNPNERIHITENKLNNISNDFDSESTNHRRNSQSNKNRFKHKHQQQHLHHHPHHHHQQHTETPPPTYHSGSDTSSCTKINTPRYIIAKNDNNEKQLYIKVGETNPSLSVNNTEAYMNWKGNSGRNSSCNKSICDSNSINGSLCANTTVSACDGSNSNSTITNNDSTDNNAIYKSEAQPDERESDNEIIYAPSSNRSLISYDNGSNQIENV